MHNAPMPRLLSAACFLLPAVCCLLLCSAAHVPTAAALANADTVALLSAARDALHKLDFPPADDGPGQPRIYFDAAASSLTALLQVHGCQWAAPELRQLYARKDAPPLRLGYSADGRIELRAEPLDLKNPAFAQYSVVLVTLTSHTARTLKDAGQASLALALPEGKAIPAPRIGPQHPLWKHLQRIAPTFATPALVPSGTGVAFKQLYAIPRALLPFNA